jgi:hypothetical protein
MEHRLDLEKSLLAGLPEQQRRDTIQSMSEATAKKLAHLRRHLDADDDIDQTD